MNIPDEAVEAAAKALYQNTLTSWDGAHARTKELCRRDARAALEAAAPHLLAEAWREGCAEGLACDWDKGAEFLPLNPYRKSDDAVQ